MKNHMMKTTTTLAALALSLGSAQAATYAWTGAGVDANDLDAVYERCYNKGIIKDFIIKGHIINNKELIKGQTFYREKC